MRPTKSSLSSDSFSPGRRPKLTLSQAPLRLVHADRPAQLVAVPEGDSPPEDLEVAVDEGRPQLVDEDAVGEGAAEALARGERQLWRTDLALGRAKKLKSGGV